MPKPISILDIIKRGGYEASIITTFNAHLPFYEEVVLRKLVSAGCRHNVVLMDKGQCAQAWNNESSRPRVAGFAYSLIPVGVSGAFHPKICILAGPKKATILIGSHNLTLSGFGYNQEVTNWIDVTGKTDAEGSSLLKATWAILSQWIELEQPNLAEEILESARAISNFISPMIANAEESYEAQVFAQSPGSSPLLEQIYPNVPADVRRITVIGAFFDHELAFISALRHLWPSAEIVVGVDPDTVYLPGQPDTAIARYVDVRSLWAGKNGYLHAKVILFDNGVVNDARLVSGSANPSRPAWLAQNEYSNVEAVLLRIGKEAHCTALEMGLFDVFNQPVLPPAEFSVIATRNRDEVRQNNTPLYPVWSSIMLNETGELRIQCTSKPVRTSRVVLFDQNESVLETFDDVTADASVINITPNCAHLHIRSCLIYVDGSVLARAIVSHPEQLRMPSRSSRKHQIRDALGALGSNQGDISKVIATVERVIFADNSIREIEVAIRRHKEHKFRTVASETLDTLAVSTDDTPKAKKKIKVLKSGDLAYLIDVLHRRLSDGLEHNTEERDKHGRNEEEQVDQDDEDDMQTADPTLTDSVIAKAVSSKARALTKKMVQRISVAQNDSAQRVSVIIQLIAVLALLRELRHLDTTKRWRQTGQLLVEDRDRRYLFDHCLEFLLGSRTGSLNVMDGITDESSEEAADMIASLLWLAWDLGLELNEQIGRIWADVEQRPALKTNGFFLRILPELIKDSAARQIFEESMTRTVRSTPAAQQLAYQWLDRHISFGERWSNHIRTTESVDVGSYCVVPGVIDEPRIVLSAPGDIVNIWEFHKETGFIRDRVVAVRPD